MEVKVEGFLEDSDNKNFEAELSVDYNEYIDNSGGREYYESDGVENIEIIITNNTTGISNEILEEIILDKMEKDDYLNYPGHAEKINDITDIEITSNDIKISEMMVEYNKEFDLIIDRADEFATYLYNGMKEEKILPKQINKQKDVKGYIKSLLLRLKSVEEIDKMFDLFDMKDKSKKEVMKYLTPNVENFKIFIKDNNERKVKKEATLNKIKEIRKSEKEVMGKNKNNINIK